MSGRTGPSRIPLFGSRIPVPGQLPLKQPRDVTPEQPKEFHEITSKNVGEKVHVSGKEGVLQFVGNVHFAQGVWCGVELPSGCGKHNGYVRGVRYFTCPESCGLMVPSCKVLLSEDVEYDEEESAPSGPHSMLFGIKDGSAANDPQQLDVNVGYRFDKSSVDCETVTNPNPTEHLDNPKLLKNENVNKSLVEDAIYNLHNATFDMSLLNTIFTVENLSYLNENCAQDNVINCESQISSVDADKRRNVLRSRNSSIESSHTNSETGISTRIRSKSEKSNTISEPITTVLYSGYKARNSTFTISEGDRRKNVVLSSRTNTTSSIDYKSCDAIISSSKVKSLKLPYDDSTSIRISETDISNSPRRRRIKCTPTSFSPALDDDITKRDSLEFEESLGILTPEQMMDLTGFAGSPSSEHIESLFSDVQNIADQLPTNSKPLTELGSPNVVDASIKDFSLGIIDEHLLSNFTMTSDTTMNMELPLDSLGNHSKVYTMSRLEQTPSPEDLPLDPTPVMESESKTEPTKSKTSSHFITSITSITSLDTGYQGDGEMSRPASRGPDHSPLTRRPQPRRPDPMTDSDFYTESDADNHEEHPLRGDRLARVIDGTLYGVDPQAAADIYVNNRENMDSSGIFTDIEGNTRNDELSSADNENRQVPDVSPSPSETSSKTISSDSQNNAPAMINKNIILEQTKNQTLNSTNVSNVEMSSKRKSPTPSSVSSSPASVRSPRHTSRDDSSVKMFKMPKRNVTSKVKAALESTNRQTKEITSRVPPQKTIGRWDAVMNKISKNTTNDKTNFKDVKSKVFTNNNTILSSAPQNASSKTQNNKPRRTRTRPDTTTPKINESLHSSASDLSAAYPAKRVGSAKKRAEVIRVTQVLTAGKLSPRNTHKTSLIENKKNVGTTVNGNEIKPQLKRTAFVSKEKKQILTSSIKDCGKAAVKGGRVSPGARPQHQNRASSTQPPKTIEGLAVLVQHLVFNLEAFRTPTLKKQIENNKLAAEKARHSYKQLEETISTIRLEHAKTLQEERAKCRKEIADIVEQHAANIAQLTHQHTETERQLLNEQDNIKQQLILSHNEQLIKLRAECTKLQHTYEQTLEILREENDSIREEIDEKNAMLSKLEFLGKESEKLEKDYRAREIHYKEELATANTEIARLKEENAKIIDFVTEGKENKVQILLAEVESLRAVLELKQTQVADLRRSIAEANQKAELLPSTVEKVSTLSARCEDLQSQLERKSIHETELINDNKKLQDLLKEEQNQTKRLLQYNEELQWKLKQNKEVVSRVLEQAEETAFSRTMLSSSFNERHNTNKQLERAMSFRERSLSSKNYNSPEDLKASFYFSCNDLSPPSSPKVKGVVEKSDSVSYVLEMEESPEMIANRIVRRSFRNSTPPKTTPTKSPANKRPRTKNTPLSLSASASAIVPSLTRTDISRSRSISVRNGDEESSSSHAYDVFMWHVSSNSTPNSYKYPKNEVAHNEYASSSLNYEHNIDLSDYNDDITLPALPSEIGPKNEAQSLPVPKHLAGEAMVFESNSEDESSTSSSSGQL